MRKQEYDYIMKRIKAPKSVVLNIGGGDWRVVSNRGVELMRITDTVTRSDEMAMHHVSSNGGSMREVFFMNGGKFAVSDYEMHWMMGDGDIVSRRLSKYTLDILTALHDKYDAQNNGAYTTALRNFNQIQAAGAVNMK